MTFHYRTTHYTTILNCLIPISAFLGFCYAYYCYRYVRKIPIEPKEVAILLKQIAEKKSAARGNSVEAHETDHINHGHQINDIEMTKITPDNNVRLVPDTRPPEEKIYEIYGLIRHGAISFLFAEYKYLVIYLICFCFVIGIVVGTTADSQNYKFGLWTAAVFIIGATTSVTGGFIGMMIATYSNARTTIKAIDSLARAFRVAYSGGSVMGFTIVSLAVTLLFIMYHITLNIYNPQNNSELKAAMRSLSAFGIGATSVSLFARVGGGIYTKAADVGADLVGKTEVGIPEDDARNPATIADNVGDNVGDIAGMGADLFGSVCGSTCASLVLSTEKAIGNGNIVHTNIMLMSLGISASGIIGCLLSSLLARMIGKCSDGIKTSKDVKNFLGLQELTSTIFALGLIWLFTGITYRDAQIDQTGHAPEFWRVAVCASCGLIGGWAVGWITEFFTSTEHSPVQDVANSSRTGAATNIIYGLALGYLSTGIPVIIVAIVLVISFKLLAAYGVALATLGVLSTLCTSLSIDAFGPIADNAGGISEMSNLPEYVRESTDILDATGNTTAAIGKGFAIVSAALVGIALLGAYQDIVLTIKHEEGHDHKYFLVDAFVFAGLLCGAMLPYIFSALTMKAVGTAALEMVEEVRDQFLKNPDIMTGKAKPNYDRCIAISTQASLKQMVLPALLAILSPLIGGFIFGCLFLLGLLSGCLVCGVQLAISSANTGGAWDNAKKLIEAGRLDGCKGKGTPEHKAAVIGDTVGDPLKDTSGPAINILIKLMGIISIVFGAAMAKTYKNGGGVITIGGNGTL